MYNNRGFTKFQITVACGLKFHWYLRTLGLGTIHEGRLLKGVGRGPSKGDLLNKVI